ncbi:MAG: hypothetical protein H6737_06200 [Alphaproteobacteria bacterium]|nr:hypothetical protein [Alphaproteobacteria bacterium]
MPREERIIAFLDMAREDLDAAEDLARTGNHHAAYLRPAASTAWTRWLPWSTYATAYRYPTVAGRKPRRLPASEVLEAVDALRVLEAEARADVS